MLRETYRSVKFPIDTSNDEYIADVPAIFTSRTPESVCPSGIAYNAYCDIRSSSNGNYFRSPILRFDSRTGEFCERVESLDGFTFILLVSHVQELPNTTFDGSRQVYGGNHVVQRDISVFNFDVENNDAIGSAIFPVGAYWGGTDFMPTKFIYDPINAKMIAPTNSVNQYEVGVYNSNTGAGPERIIRMAGEPFDMHPMNPPYGLSFSDNTGVVTQFNYLTGQIMAVLKMPDLDSARGATSGERRFGYDRYNHRILILDLVDQDANNEEQMVIRGFNPNPVPWQITPPVVNREPRVGRKVKIFTKVYTQAGIGIGQKKVTFTDQGVGDVAPQIVTTDQDGWAVAEYDGLATGGAETITVSVEQDEGIFPPSQTQGSGADGWAPEVHLDFNNQTVNADVSSIITQQQDWTKGTTYGTFGDILVKRASKVSSAELFVESGATTTAGTGGGTFGGSLVLDTSGNNTVPYTQRGWVGAWVYFPTGFDFTDSTGLRLFRLQDNAIGTTSNFVLRLKHTAGAHTGYTLEWPDQTVTDARHDFLAHSSVLTSPDTWHFIQYSWLMHPTDAIAEQYLWIDDLLIWQLENTAAQYRDSAGGGSLTSFTANEAIGTSNSIWSEMYQLEVLNVWGGAGAPATQRCYIQDVVWSRDPTEALPLDENGNRYISNAFAENL
jgi:hypothetical protein